MASRYATKATFVIDFSFTCSQCRGDLEPTERSSAFNDSEKRSENFEIKPCQRCIDDALKEASDAE